MSAVSHQFETELEVIILYDTPYLNIKMSLNIFGGYINHGHYNYTLVQNAVLANISDIS